MVGLQREATADTSVAGHTLPKGSKLWIDVMGIHHNPTYWPDPEVRTAPCFRACRQQAASSMHMGRHLPGFRPLHAAAPAHPADNLV